MRLNITSFQTIAGLLLLSACGGSTTLGPANLVDPVPNFSASVLSKAPDANGVFTEPLTQSFQNAIVTSVGDTNGVSYIVGQDASGQTQAFVGFLPDTTGGTTVAKTAPSAVYSGNVHVLTRPVTGTGGSPTFLLTSVDLTANFGTQTLIGTSNDQTATTPPSLSVNGTILGAEIGGSVTFQGLNGTLVGVIGDERAVAGFGGQSASTVLLGGFYATPSP